MVLPFVILIASQLPVEIDLHFLHTLGAVVECCEEPDYGLLPNHMDSLLPYPKVGEGDLTPFEIWRYVGKGKSSFMDPNLSMGREDWLSFNSDRKRGLCKM